MFEALREFPSRNKRQQPLRSPECHSRGSGAGALQADFAQVEFGRGEIGIRRVVLVKTTDLRIAEENAAAAIWLQAVFMGVDDDGVSFGDASKGSSGVCVEIRRQF